MAGWLALAMPTKESRCKSTSPRDGWEMAGRWLGGCPWLFPKIAGVILNRCTMVGTLLGGWHQLVPTIVVVIVDRQEMGG